MPGFIIEMSRRNEALIGVGATLLTASLSALGLPPIFWAPVGGFGGAILVYWAIDPPVDTSQPSRLADGGAASVTQSRVGGVGNSTQVIIRDISGGIHYHPAPVKPHSKEDL